MLRDLLLDCYHAAVAGADPAATTAEAVGRLLGGAEEPLTILAVGKAGPAMATAAVEACATLGLAPAGGLVIGVAEAPPPHPSLGTMVGDHPLPGPRSFAAARRLGELVERTRGRGTVLVLVSGGTSSLVAAPADGLDEADLVRLYEALLASGADIRVMNTVRKRFARWAAGRLAAALAPARVVCLLVSDVAGDDPAAIGSGPCVPDETTAASLRALLAREGLEHAVPQALRDRLGDDAPLETPKPGDPAFAHVTVEVVLGNAQARRAAARRARALGLAPVLVVDEPLADDAALTGSRLAEELVRFREAGLADGESHRPLTCMIWGGETVVTLDGTDAPPGGRCQELALSAAFALDALGPRGEGIALLAAGTDGRDGTTPAAGAIVDASTIPSIVGAGRDPRRDLDTHRAHDALAAAGALLQTGPSGTNVGDVVIGVAEVRR
jgi:glycerate 2-kinase